MPPLPSYSLLLLLHILPLTILLPLVHGDCIPCRYGASTVVCPQPAGSDPANAMTDFACLCSKRDQYEITLSSCFSNSDLPDVCSPTDDSEHKRIRLACREYEPKSSSTKTAEKEGTTKTETVKPIEKTETLQTTRTIAGASISAGTTSYGGAGGIETTFIQRGDGGETTYTVTYYTSEFTVPGAGTIVPTGTIGEVPTFSGPQKPGSGGNGDWPGDGNESSGPNSNSAQNVGRIIGVVIGAVAGVIVFGIIVVEVRRRLKIRAENRRVAEELKEAMRGMPGWGSADGAAELPPAELSGEGVVSELDGQEWATVRGKEV